MTAGEPGAAPLVGVIMGSASDWETLKAATEVLARFGVPYEARVVSAHRTPALLTEYAGSARARGLKAIIAGAGGAAHLPGMTAANTTLPVVGVPVQSQALRGLDSLLSIVQMPRCPRRDHGYRQRRSGERRPLRPPPACHRGREARRGTA